VAPPSPRPRPSAGAGTPGSSAATTSPAAPSPSPRPSAGGGTPGPSEAPRPSPREDGSVTEKLVEFLLLKPDQLDQRVAMLRACALQGKSIGNDGVKLNAAAVESAAKLAAGRLPGAPHPASWGGSGGHWWEESSGTSWWKDEAWWGASDSKWQENGHTNGDAGNGTRGATAAATSAAWPPCDDAVPSAEPRAQPAAAAAPVADDQSASRQAGQSSEDADPDPVVVERLITYIRQAKDKTKALALIRSTASGVPRSAAEAAIAKCIQSSVVP